MTSSRPAVCVVGGGISGLVVAHALISHERAPDVVVLEASDRLGGAVRTDTVEGIPVEAGADSFLARTPAAVDLCASMGLGGDLIAPAVFGASILRDARPPSLVEMPPDFVFGMPATPRAALRAKHLGRLGGARAALEPFLPGGRLTADVSVGALVRRRFGRRALLLSVDPLLAGTRAGRVDEMSFEAALPQLWGLVRGRRNIMRALSQARGSGALPAGPPPFKSVVGGLGRLVDALRDRLVSADVRTSTRVESVEPDGGRLRVRLAGSTVDCDAVVIATPSFESARVLRAANRRASELLQSIEFASVATIVLVYPPGAGTAGLPGSGMLVPSTQDRALSACTWYSIKWPHAAPPDGGLVVRSFVGRASESEYLGLSDDALVDHVARETGEALGIRTPPRTAHLTRWPRSLPQYRVGHVGLVDRIEDALGATPGIWVTGASYRGSGIPDCVRHARAVAGRVLEWLEP